MYFISFLTVLAFHRVVINICQDFHFPLSLAARDLYPLAEKYGFGTILSNLNLYLR